MTENEMSIDEAMMRAVEDAAGFVAVMSGIKAQFVNAGWNETLAEAMTLAMLQNSTAVLGRKP